MERKVITLKSIRCEIISILQLLNTHDAHKLDFKLLIVDKIEVLFHYFFLKCYLQDFGTVKRNDQSRDRVEK